MLEIKLTEYDAGAVEAGTGDVFVVEIEGYDEPVKIERWMTHHGSGVDLYSAKTGHNIEGSVTAYLDEQLGDERGTAVFEYLTGDFLSEVSDRYERSLNAEGYYEMAKRAKACAEATPFKMPEEGGVITVPAGQGELVGDALVEDAERTAQQQINEND